MTKSYLKHLQQATRTPTDFVRVLMPYHLGGIYAYLANDLTVGMAMTVGFLVLNFIAKR